MVYGQSIHYKKGSSSDKTTTNSKNRNQLQ